MDDNAVIARDQHSTSIRELTHKRCTASLQPVEVLQTCKRENGGPLVLQS
jgi:hypothetical protein